jgi:integrase
VFPTAGCNPKLNFLDDLKAVAERAKLDPENFWRHKFRATFATRCLGAGVDLRTVQQWLGHSDMESTMHYLKPSRGQKVREKGERDFRLKHSHSGGVDLLSINPRAPHGQWV